MAAMRGYKLRETLYKTEYCVTCLATDSKTLKPVLLKVPAGEAAPDDAAERLRREAEIIRLLHPDGCLRFEEEHTPHHNPVLVAGTGDLVPLRRHAGARGLPTATFLPLAVRLAGIIARLHRHGLIHGDLNPDILLIDAQNNTPYLFDCSRAIKAGAAAGDQVPYLPPDRRPFSYLSPEQTGRLNRPVDRRTDTYSLGVILYELATGRLPVAAGDPLEWFHALVAGEIKAPHELEAAVPAVISDIVMKCLSRDPENRYQSAVGVENDLLECLAQWQQKGRVDHFAVGCRDGPVTFHFSPAFIGKKRELGLLRAALERAARGPGAAVLISGEAGSGKTRLAQEFMQQVNDQHGFVITGKFGVLKSAVPYQPITGALDRVLDRIMSGSREEMEYWKRQITANLGAYVSALTEIMPRVRELVGEQPQMAVPTILQEQQRFLHAFARLAQLFARKGAPLVFFLDDLQWADPESLKMLAALLIKNRVQHLLFIGAFREAEAAENRFLVETRRAMEREQVDLLLLPLEPATLEEIAALVADSLRCSDEGAGPLAEFLRRQTGGNLLFVKELVESMHKDGFIAYQAGERGWRWDWRRLPDTPYAGDLIQFLLEKLERLPAETRNVIQVAACAGGTFPAGLIAAASGAPAAAVEGHLGRCLDEGLIEEKSAGVYGFVHDRVHQAAYLSLAERERQAVHYLLGRLVLDQSGGAPGEIDTAALFAAVDQLNLGLAVLVEKGENIRGAELNLMAGQKAKRALAFSAALGYLRTGLSLLDGGAWETGYPLVYRLSMERLECEYLCDNFTTAESLYSELITRARTILDRTPVRLIRILFLTMREMYPAAIATGLEGLRDLGCPLPAKPSWWHLLQALVKFRLLLYRTGAGRVTELPPVKDRRVEAVLNLLTDIGPSTYVRNHNLLALISLRTAELSLRHGNSHKSGSGYIALATILLHSFRDYRTAVPLAQAALELAGSRGSVADKYTVNFMYGAFVHPWVGPLRDSEPFLNRAMEYSLASCDLTYGGYAMYFHVIAMYSAGAPLPELEARIRDYSQHERRLPDTYFSFSLAIFRQFSRALRGLTREPLSLSDAGFDEDAFYREIGAKRDRQGEVFGYCLCKGQLCYLFGDYPRALSLLAEAGRLTKLYYGAIFPADQALYYCLAVLAMYPRLPACERAVLRLRLLGQKRRLERWARHCPANFEHKHLLVAAELARIARQDKKAALLYERAVRSAQENGYPQIAAVACERAAGFYREQGLDVPAREYLRAARDGYRAWGAAAKVEQLLSLYPWLAGEEEKREEAPAGKYGEAGRNLSEAVDMRAVYRAAQVLSGTIVLDELLLKMMEVVMQNAGADRGAFLMYREGQLYIEAMAGTGPGGIGVDVLPSLPLELSGLLPRSIVSQAVVGGETIVLDNAARDARFGSDPGVAGREPLSVLCLPVVRQGRPVGVLYLENSVTAGCFHPGRVEALQLLAAQIAIAVENAALYRSLQQMNATLEEKVRERTESLARLQKETLDALLEKSRLEERNRIAREIHDTVGHTLTSVLVQIEAGKRLLRKDAGLVAQKLEQCQEQLRKGLDDIRRSLRLLRGSGAPDGAPDLETLIQDVVKNTGVTVDYGIDPLPRLDPARRYVLYRALQEGLTNGIRHGGSKSFYFSLTEENGTARFLLQDYGTGTDQIHPGFGLTSMRERVKELNGDLAVYSRAGEGCRIEITLPLA
ncbi:hypothetical protein SY88_18810 [Clostridiales bacterium PH28_bin88]|nr:hypothetical protein SY88_18810 [Clostridiales bacterium PH28_bin88]